MKNLTKLSLITLLTIFISSCSSSSSDIDHLPPMKIEIPAVLESDEEIVEFIEQSEKLINQYTIDLEESVQDFLDSDLAGKEVDDMSTFEKIKLTALTGKIAMNFSEFGLEFSEMHDKSQEFEEDLSPEKIKALETVMNAFAMRMQELEDKYKNMDVKK